MAPVPNGAKISGLMRICNAPKPESNAELRIDEQRLIVVLDRSIVVTLLRVRQPTVVESSEVTWIEPQGLAVILNCILEGALVPICQSALIKRISIARF